eukprot:51215-Hanusia_phi.AAC.1
MSTAFFLLSSPSSVFESTTIIGSLYSTFPGSSSFGFASTSLEASLSTLVAPVSTPSVVPPSFTGLGIYPNVSYTNLPCDYSINIAANFQFKINSFISLLGLRLSTRASVVYISGNGLARAALWNSHMLNLTVQVISPGQESVSFNLVSQSPSSSQASIIAKLSCSFCAEGSQEPVQPFSSNYSLAFNVLPPPTCQGSKFGIDCKYTCYGMVVGSTCMCSSGQFGFLCNQSATLNTEVSNLASTSQLSSIRSKTGIGVSIPAGSLSMATKISVKVYEVSNLQVGPQQGLIQPAGPVVVFEPSGLRFKLPVTIFTPYDPSKIPAGKQPYIFYNNESAAQPWQQQESEVVIGKNLTRAAVSHFSGYMTMAANPPSTSSSRANSTLTNQSSTPTTNVLAVITSPSALALILGLVGGGGGLLVMVSVCVVVRRFAKRQNSTRVVDPFSSYLISDDSRSAALIRQSSTESTEDTHQADQLDIILENA